MKRLTLAELVVFLLYRFLSWAILKADYDDISKGRDMTCEIFLKGSSQQPIRISWINYWLLAVNLVTFLHSSSAITQPLSYPIIRV